MQVVPMIVAWIVHAVLTQATPADLVTAAARGALHGCLDAPERDDRRIRLAPVRWDAVCHDNPLARGCP
jgi:hypothetical protein